MAEPMKHAAGPLDCFDWHWGRMVAILKLSQILQLVRLAAQVMNVPDTTLDRIAAIERECREQREEQNAVKGLVAASLTAVAESLKPTNARFARLASEWKQSESPSSSARELAMHPAYQQIIGMGPVAIGWIIQELENEPDHWFWALHCLTGGADPVPVSDRGDINAMAAAWIQWASENDQTRSIV